MAVMNKWAIADIYKKCHGTERKLPGSQGGRDLAAVIENRRRGWVDVILEKVNQCCRTVPWIIHEASGLD